MFWDIFHDHVGRFLNTISQFNTEKRGKNYFKIVEDEFVRKITQKLCFLESNSSKYRKLPQIRPQNSNSLQNFDYFWYNTLLAPSGAYATLKKVAIYIVKLLYQGINIGLFMYSMTTGDSIFLFYTTPKVRGIQKSPQKANFWTFHKPPKCPFFAKSNPLC